MCVREYPTHSRQSSHAEFDRGAVRARYDDAAVELDDSSGGGPSPMASPTVLYDSDQR